MDLITLALAKRAHSQQGSYDDTELSAAVRANTSAIAVLNGGGTGSVSKIVTDKIAEIVNNAPDDLDTLKEISDWISEHSEDASAMNSQILSNKNDIENLSDTKADITVLNDYVKNTNVVSFPVDPSQATVQISSDPGLVKIHPKYGINAIKEGYDNCLFITAASDNQIEYETDQFHPLTSRSIPKVMSEYGMNSKNDIPKIKESLAITEQSLGYTCKNLIKNNCQSRTVNGVAATVNSDGSITLNGANTGSAANVFYFCIENGSSSTNNSTVKFYSSGKYILSGELDDRAYIQYCYYDESGIHTLARTQKNITVTDAMTANSTRLIITAGAVFNNETIYPMLRPADITDDTYEPYKPSVEERLAALEAAIMRGEAGNAI